MADSISTLAAKLRPHWLRDLSSNITAVSAAGTPGVTDHGALSGLLDDDHTQYLTNARGDARYLSTLSAGAGLTLTMTPVITLDVGVSGLGLTVAPDAVTLSSSSDVGTTPAAAILASTAAGALTLNNGFFNQGAQSLTTFASGFAGSGWRADYGLTTASRASVETDDLTVRGRMRVYELLIQQIRATNGSVLVSSSSKVYAVTTATDPAWTVNGTPLYFNATPAELSTTLYDITTASSAEDVASKRTYHGFLVGDVIRAQRVEWNGSAFGGVIQSDLEVTSVVSLYEYIAAKVSGDAATVGYDYVRLGNTSDTSRQGVVYLTSDDSAAPFIDIADNISYHSDWNTAGKIKARLGKLTGVTDYDFGGALSGYGLYSQNVYLKGRIVVTGGSLGGLAAADVNSNTTTIDGGHITTGTVTADQIQARAITGDNLSLTSYLAINSATYGDAGVQLQFNGGSPRAYIGNGLDRYLRFDGTNVEISGYITTTGGSISGNLYAGMNNIRLGMDGQRFKMPATDALNINTSESAFRWFENLDVVPDATTNYAGMVAYRNTYGGNNIIDLLSTSYVGTTNYTAYAARNIMQAGNFDGATYRGAYLLVQKDPGATMLSSVISSATYTVIDGMLRIEAKAPATIQTGYIYTYVTTGLNYVIAYTADGATFKYRYMSLTSTNATWTYSTVAPS